MDGENTKEEAAKKNLPIWLWSDVGESAKTEGTINQPVGAAGVVIENGINLTKTNQQITREIVEFNTQAAMREAAGDATGAASSRLADDIASRSYPSTRSALVGKDFFKGLAKGIAGAVANYLIDRGSDSYEFAKAQASIDVYENTNDNDNNIGIVATNPK